MLLSLHNSSRFYVAPYFQYSKVVIIVVIIMSYTAAPSQAILFPEDLGYLLHKSLAHGAQGQCYVVKSLNSSSSNKFYVRKKLPTPKDCPEKDFYLAIPSHLAPKLISQTLYYSSGPALIYAYCNGGDLGRCLAKLKQAGLYMPEALVWAVVSKICEVLAWCHSGWTADPRTEHIEHLHGEWNWVTHNDLHEGNIFLHFPKSSDNSRKSKSPIPEVLVGDWGHSSQRTKTTRITGKSYATNKELTRVRGLFGIFSSSRDTKFVGFEGDPVMLFDQWWDEAKAMKEVDVARYIAERLVSYGKEEVSRLSMDTNDLSWTRPKVSKTALTFSSDLEERYQEMKRWERTNNHRQNIVEPYSWVSV